MKGKALYWIEQNGGLELWLENDGKGTGWLKTLEKLKQKLESPMPPEKKIKKPEELDKNPWAINDVYAYQFHKRASEEKGIFGKYMLIPKIGEEVSSSWLHSFYEKWQGIEYDTVGYGEYDYLGNL